MQKPTKKNKGNMTKNTIKNKQFSTIKQTKRARRFFANKREKSGPKHNDQQIVRYVTPNRYTLRFTVHLICTVFPFPLEVGVLILNPVEPEALRPNAFLLLLADTLKPVDARRGDGKFLTSVLRMGDVGRGMA